MNKIINKFLLNEDKFMPELHLKQPSTKHRERIQKFRNTGNIYIYIYIYIYIFIFIYIIYIYLYIIYIFIYYIYILYI